MSAPAAIAAPSTVPDIHPLADLFPAMRDAELAELVDDVRRNGLTTPILLHWDGRVIDGRHRLKACLAAGIAPRFERWSGDGDLATLIISLNLHRRHLDESQKALLAAKLESFSWGGARRYGSAGPAASGAAQDANWQLAEPVGDAARQQLEPNGVTRAKAAALFNVSERSIARAAVVRDAAVPALRGQVERGELSVAAAEPIARRPAAEQAEIVARGRDEILEAAKVIRLERFAAKRVRRDAREAALAGATARASRRLGERLYGVIYADPATRYRTWSAGGTDRSAENHYPTMSEDELRALTLPAAPDCVLFLWSTVPLLAVTLDIMQGAWGFAYKSSAAWDKGVRGTGYWFLNEHEILLVGTRGSVPAPHPGTQGGSMVRARRGPHSEKPAAVAAMIERLFPTVPKLEMFARTRRPGWDAWGNELTPLADGGAAACA